MKTAVLLSGGIDSIALAYGLNPSLAITVDYGQRAAEAEIFAAREITSQLSIPHEILRIDCGILGRGTMSSQGDQLNDSCAPTEEWWPYRNQLLITLAAPVCLRHNIEEVWTGTVNSDKQHKDGTPQFFELIDHVVSMQEGGLRVRAPALNLSTCDLVKKFDVPLSLIGWSHSCHTSVLPCGTCRGCLKHLTVMRELYGHV